VNRYSHASHWHLLLSLLGRDIRARYRGSMLGLFWALINPVLLMGVYYFVFSVVFQIRLPELYGGRQVPFAGFIFAGIILYFAFSEVLTRSPALIQDNSNYVKKVVFPLEILPVVCVLSAGFNFLVGFLVLLLFLVVSGYALSLSLLALPLLLLPYLLLLLGLAWFISALAVYIRDVVYVVGFLATALLFLSPVLYAVDSVPETFRAIMLWNPLTNFIETFRLILLGGQWPGFGQLLQAWITGLLVALFGYAFFQRVRHGFADIL
jgi:lipopolysaccharide transport system permease protein